MANDNTTPNNRQEYRQAVQNAGKKEFTLLKMQEYGFWPANLPTPYERQQNETKDDYNKRKELNQEYQKVAKQIADLYQEKDEIDGKLKQLRKQYDQTWDYDKIRKDVAQQIMQESIERRKEKKRLQELERAEKSAQWQTRKAESILFIGKGYSNLLADKENDIEKLSSLGLPIMADDKALAYVLGIEYKDLRFLTYHRDVVTSDHYHHYTIEKRNGKVRHIAAPKSTLKEVQRTILKLMLEKIEISEQAHGFLKGKSVVTGASIHNSQPQLLINMDLENFFPTLTFERVRGMFQSFGYSGYLASLLAMLCTYCERMPIEVKGQVRYVKTSDRVLPQGSPASPMITNIICRRLDARLADLAVKYRFAYSRYADDMSFSFEQCPDNNQIRTIVYEISSIVKDEGFKVNQEKTRYLKKNNRQCITGVVVNNEDLGVPKVWLKRMRAAIYNANKVMTEKGQELPDATINEISGMMAWLKTVNQERYQKIIDDAQKLLNQCKK